MKGLADTRDEAYARDVARIKQNLSGPKSLGYYIQLLFLAGAVAAILMNRAWGTLWALLGLIPMSPLVATKTFFWNWTERLLKRDAEAGRFRRAAHWDYLSFVIDALQSLVISALMTFAVFWAAGGALALPFAWICVGAFHTFPFVFMRQGVNYDWGFIPFWDQWTLIVIVVLSVFLPITPLWGVALQAAGMVIAAPLVCLYGRKQIKDKVKRYFDYAKKSHVLYVQTPPAQTYGFQSEGLKATLSDLEIRWMPLAASVCLLLAGLGWSLWLRCPWAVLLAVAALVLGYLSSQMFGCPTSMESEELAKRRIDVDLASRFFDLRAFILMFSLAVASATVLLLGGDDLYLIAALALSAVGACTLTAAVSGSDATRRADFLLVLVYAVALGTVVALRVADLVWWACLLPLPALAYLLPVYRWFFPRSGLRDEARRAAIAEMPERFAADIRTSAQRAQDEKREKRRLRDERRLASLRRSSRRI